MNTPRKICFYAQVKDRSVLERVGFYSQDLQILNDLGFEVQIAIKPSELRSADLFFVWWWTWAFIPTTVARILQKPVLITGVFDYWQFPERPVYQRALMSYALRAADGSVFISRMEKEEVTRNLQVSSPYYSPLTIDSALYQPSGNPRESFALCFAGSGMNNGNSKRKCIEEVIRSVPLVRQRYPDFRLVIAGQKGTDYPGLEAVARELGVEGAIDFPGIVSLEEKIDLMQTCGLYMQPTRFEGFGLSILEAMSCGAPVVTSPEGAVPELVEDTAIMVDGTSPDSIASGVISLLQNKELRERCGHRARERAASLFAYERRKEDLKQILFRMLAISH